MRIPDGRSLLAPLTALVLLASGGVQASKSEPVPDLPGLRAMVARFAPVELRADVAKLPPNEQEALREILRAAALMDALFLRQVWAGNQTLLLDLSQDASELGRARLDAFRLHKGPWDRLEHDRPFIPGVPPKPPSGSFYTADDKASVEKWVKTLKGPARAQATGFFTTVRRDPRGRFTAVPYSVEYQPELQLASEHLRRAALLTAQPTLRRYLTTRADAFLSNDYYASDVAWMELDSSIEPTVGPYEVYEDGWFAQKAAFQAFVTLRDEVETAKLQRLSGELQGLEDTLPIEPRFRNRKLGTLSPIRVVNSLFSSGDANRGVQTAAFNLPNDERITREKGAKRTMLKNVQEAKFRLVLVPISQVALTPAAQANVDFDAFFTFILMHELMHGLGPNAITVGGKKTTVRAELQDAYSAIEEAKADISGMWALGQLADRGVLDEALAERMYDTYLAGCFRTIRFGVNEAHGRGKAMQLNFLLDQGAVRVREDGRFEVVREKIRPAAEALTRQLMTLQATGDRAGAKKLLETAVIRPPVQKVLDQLRDVPTDIRPRFVSAEALLARPPAARP
jgi:hypothetical protein